jgi:hypothetical protein
VSVSVVLYNSQKKKNKSLCLAFFEIKAEALPHHIRRRRMPVLTML